MKKHVIFTILSVLALSFSVKNALAYPSCEKLGYGATEEDCKGYVTLKCPFNRNQIYCDKSVSVDCELGSYYSEDDTQCYSTISDYVIIGTYGGGPNCLAVSNHIDGELSSNFDEITSTVPISYIAAMIRLRGKNALVGSEIPDLLIGTGYNNKKYFVHTQSGLAGILDLQAIAYYTSKGAKAGKIKEFLESGYCELEEYYSADGYSDCFVGGYWDDEDQRCAQGWATGLLIVHDEPLAGGSMYNIHYVNLDPDQIIRHPGNPNVCDTSAAGFYCQNIGAEPLTVKELKVLREKIYLNTHNVFDGVLSYTNVDADNYGVFIGEDGCLDFNLSNGLEYGDSDELGDPKTSIVCKYSQDI